MTMSSLPVIELPGALVMVLGDGDRWSLQRRMMAIAIKIIKTWWYPRNGTNPMEVLAQAAAFPERRGVDSRYQPTWNFAMLTMCSYSSTLTRGLKQPSPVLRDSGATVGFWSRHLQRWHAACLSLSSREGLIVRGVDSWCEECEVSEVNGVGASRRVRNVKLGSRRTGLLENTARNAGRCWTCEVDDGDSFLYVRH